MLGPRVAECEGPYSIDPTLDPTLDPDPLPTHSKAPEILSDPGGFQVVAGTGFDTVESGGLWGPMPLVA